MKFKVGDKVRFKNDVYIIEETVRYYGFNLYWFNYDWYEEDELELVTDPLADKIQERNNKPDEPHDPIKPAHYRKGEIDLFESWYRTYPFNEFRAGMQMIAERYMKRDKHDRVEDTKKSIETLTRLKEYEEMEK